MHPLAVSDVPARSALADDGLVVLSSIDDLHDADLAQVLADRLAESAVALRAAAAVVERSLRTASDSGLPSPWSLPRYRNGR